MSKDKVGIIATRLGGIDGVSLEVDKWVRVLRKNGVKVYLCAGDKVSGYLRATVVPALSVSDRDNKKIINDFFEEGSCPVFLDENIKHLAVKIEKAIARWLKKHKIKKIIVENINSLPIHVPAAIAIDNILKKNPDTTALFHHHDFHWERRVYFGGCKKIGFYLKKYFPPKRKNALHVTINSIAQRFLLKKYGIKSIVIPNIFDHFTAPKDKYNSTLRKDIGLKKDDLFFVVPVRIVPRKNIEEAIKLVKLLKNPKIKLVIAGCADPYDLHSQVYFRKIHKLSHQIEGRVKFICARIGPQRRFVGAQKIYSLFDVYAHADFVLYPTLYEGWGNAFGEATAFGLPVLVNRYEVFKKDIEKFGFDVVKINNGKLGKSTVKEVADFLKNKGLKEHVVKHNQELIKKHFGPGFLMKKLKPFLKS